LLRDSPVRLLILNGNAVVKNFKKLPVFARKTGDAHWSLPRRTQPGVTGFAYKGALRELSGVRFERRLLVLGFNHNIQSSFGVTTEIIAAIRRWIALTADDAFS